MNTNTPGAADALSDAVALLGKYKKLCVDIGRGDSFHRARIDAAVAALSAPASVADALTPESLNLGGRYNWRNRPERLVYIGPKHYRGDPRRWHQFGKVETPGVVWREVLDSDISHFEKSAPAPVAGVPSESQALTALEKIEVLLSKVMPEDSRGQPEAAYLVRQLRDALAAPSAAAPGAARPAMKHWCDTCEGTGSVHQEHQAGCHAGGDHSCPDCDGNGYWTPSAATGAIDAREQEAALTKQQICDRFSFLEGRVSEDTYRKIADTAFDIQRERQLAACNFCLAQAAEARAALASQDEAPAPSAMTLSEFCAEAERIGLTADVLGKQLAKRPDFADCLPPTQQAVLVDAPGAVRVSQPINQVAFTQLAAKHLPGEMDPHDAWLFFQEAARTFFGREIK